MKKCIFKIIALVLIQAFLLLDFAWCGDIGDITDVQQRREKISTLSPKLTLDVQLLQTAFSDKIIAEKIIDTLRRNKWDAVETAKQLGIDKEKVYEVVPQHVVEAAQIIKGSSRSSPPQQVQRQVKPKPLSEAPTLEINRKSAFWKFVRLGLMVITIDQAIKLFAYYFAPDFLTTSGWPYGWTVNFGFSYDQVSLVKMILFSLAGISIIPLAFIAVHRLIKTKINNLRMTPLFVALTMFTAAIISNLGELWIRGGKVVNVIAFHLREVYSDFQMYNLSDFVMQISGGIMLAYMVHLVAAYRKEGHFSAVRISLALVPFVGVGLFLNPVKFGFLLAPALTSAVVAFVLLKIFAQDTSRSIDVEQAEEPADELSNLKSPKDAFVRVKMQIKVHLKETLVGLAGMITAVIVWKMGLIPSFVTREFIKEITGPLIGVALVVFVVLEEIARHKEKKQALAESAQKQEKAAEQSVAQKPLPEEITVSEEERDAGYIFRTGDMPSPEAQAESTTGVNRRTVTLEQIQAQANKIYAVLDGTLNRISRKEGVRLDDPQLREKVKNRALEIAYNNYGMLRGDYELVIKIERKENIYIKISRISGVMIVYDQAAKLKFESFKPVVTSFVPRVDQITIEVEGQPKNLLDYLIERGFVTENIKNIDFSVETNFATILWAGIVPDIVISRARKTIVVDRQGEVKRLRVSRVPVDEIIALKGITELVNIHTHGVNDEPLEFTGGDIEDIRSGFYQGRKYNVVLVERTNGKIEGLLVCFDSEKEMLDYLDLLAEREKEIGVELLDDAQPEMPVLKVKRQLVADPDELIGQAI